MELSLLNKLQGIWFWFNFYHITSHYFENAPSRIVYHVDTRNFHIFAISQKFLKGLVALDSQRINFSIFLYALLFLGRQITIVMAGERELSFLLSCTTMSLPRQTLKCHWGSKLPKCLMDTPWVHCEIVSYCRVMASLKQMLTCSTHLLCPDYIPFHLAPVAISLHI